MALFDKSRMYGTPGYGDGIPGNQQIGAPPMPDLSLGGVIPEAPQGGGGLFGRLGKVDWGSTLLGGLADGVAMWGGAKPGYARAMAEQSANAQELKKAQLLARMKAEMDASNDQRDREAQQSAWIAQQQWKRDNPEATDAQRNYEYRQQLPDAQRGEFDRTRPGFQFTPEGIAAMAQIAQGRAAATAKYRAPKAGKATAKLPTGFILD